MGAAAGTAATAAATSAVAGSAANALIGGVSSGAAGLTSAATQQGMYQQALANQMPFISTGQQANAQLMNELTGGQLGQPFNMTQAQLEQFPGYQFALQQGLESTQNAAAARGLGVSGAALKGAASYATGLASQNYQNAFTDYWANQNNRYNMLAGLSTLGGNVASNAGTQAVQAGSNIGAAQAGGISGLGTGLGNAVGTQIASPYLTNALSGGTAGLTNAQQMTGFAGAVQPGQVLPGGFVG